MRRFTCQNFSTKNLGGFTVIELLVVIAIIGILATIVVVPLNDVRNKGRDASAKTSMSDIRVYADVFFTNNGYSYDNGVADICDDAQIVTLRDAAENQTGNTTTCESNSSAYAVWVQLRAVNTYFCVDSDGFSGDIGLSPPLPGSTVC
ncbi:MAG: Uncharacterized protein G01um101429_864 [Parcubacteria group bacterium Gr01-1014_29]|nr:MAG: Uncharacterized protein G01um101429_864 [Parcubacteria group bacterium Gr01-1014_29]